MLLSREDLSEQTLKKGVTHLLHVKITRGDTLGIRDWMQNYGEVQVFIYLERGTVPHDYCLSHDCASIMCLRHSHAISHAHDFWVMC